MPDKKSTTSRGVLNRKTGLKHFNLEKYFPSAELKTFIEHYWIVKWNLEDREAYEQTVLSHPSVHLVFERNNTFIWGVITETFKRVLKGNGEVFGIKFKPAGFYPFIEYDVSYLTDKKLKYNDVFDENVNSIEKDLLRIDKDVDKVTYVDNLFLNLLPEKEYQIKRINKIVNEIINNIQILQVDDITEKCYISKRSLQRNFKKYIGVNPKWVIKRYRLHEAAEQINDGDISSFSQLSQSLGYYDQAHFINDFKSIIGKTPTEYAESLK